MKSASAHPRGGAREPSMLSALHQGHADRLLEQMQRCAYGFAAPALRRRGGAKNFLAGGGEPQRLT